MQSVLSHIKRLLTSNGAVAFLFVSTLIVNIGNYGLNVALARWLGPVGFAEANIIAIIAMLFSFVGMGLQLMTTRFVSEYNAENKSEESLSFLKYVKSSSIKVGLIATVVMLIFSTLVASYLNFESSMPLIIIFVGIVPYFLMSVHRGYHQGVQDFKKLAFTYMIEMIVRLVLTIGLLIAFLDQNISTEIVALGFLASFFVTYLQSNVKSDSQFVLSPEVRSRIIKVIALISFYELSQILINNSDVILVKHYFDNENSGLYASIALIGRAVFFATWIVVTILFPKVIDKEKRGESHQHLFFNSLIIVFVIDVVFVAICYLLGEFIIGVAFGEAYLSVSSLLWQYTLSTSLFALANVFVYYFMSLQKYLPVYISIAAGILQIICISFFNEGSLESVIRIQLLFMSLLLVSMIIYYKIQQSTRPVKVEVLKTYSQL
jgi:O-antigen/teichoic acid export membrane protein